MNLTIDESIIFLEKALNKIASFDDDKDKTDFILDIVNEYKQLLLYNVMQPEAEKQNDDFLATLAGVIRTLSRINNKNPNLLNDFDKKRLLKAKETLSKSSNINLEKIPKQS